MDTYDALVIAQRGLCACCDKIPDGGLRLAVDHDHVTGAVRGLLCRKCNAGIGMLGDTESDVANALRYLQRVHAERAA